MIHPYRRNRRLMSCMRPYRPREVQIVDEIVEPLAHRLGRGVVVGQQIGREVVRVHRFDVGGERLGAVHREPARHQRPLVAVHPHHEGHRMLPALGVHGQRVVGNRPAVDVRGPDVAGAQERAARSRPDRREHLAGRGRPHRRERRLRVEVTRPEGGGDGRPLRLGRRQVPGVALEGPVPAVNPVALGDGAVEEPGGLRHQHDRHHRPAPGRLAEDGHAAGVAAERRDVVAHPLEARHHVEEPVVARGAVRRLGRQGGVGEKAEDVQAVVDGHHHRALGRQSGAVVDGGRARAAGVAAAVDPVEHRQGLGRLRRRPHVQEEAVLALSDALPPALDADRARLAGVAHPVPGHDRRRGTPAQLAYGRGRERDALERDDPVDRGFRPLDQAAGDRHRRVGRQHDRRRTALTGGRRRGDREQPRGQPERQDGPPAAHNRPKTGPDRRPPLLAFNPIPHRSPPARPVVQVPATLERCRSTQRGVPRRLPAASPPIVAFGFNPAGARTVLRRRLLAAGHFAASAARSRRRAPSRITAIE